MRRRKKEKQKPGSPLWMTTYGDMVTLLMTFFILMFAMSEIDTQRFREIISSFQGSIGVLESGTSIQATEYVNSLETVDNTDINLNELQSLKKLQEILKNYLNETNMGNKILVELEDKGLILRFKDNVLFDSGSAEIKQEAEPALHFITDILKQDEFNANNIRVEGHTDSDPIISSKQFPTNWELSVTRASTVVRFLIERGKIGPDRLSAAGYGQYKPIASNDNEGGKSKNRRVDIVILREEYE